MSTIQKLKLTPREPMPTRLSRTVESPVPSLISIGLLMMAFLTGCQTAPKVVVIPADREIRFLRTGQVLTNQSDVYLVPPARMQEILRALAQPLPPTPSK